MTNFAEQIDPTAPIDEAILSHTATELWGDPVYGHSAESFIRTFDSYGTASVWRNGDTYYLSPYMIRDELSSQRIGQGAEAEIARAAGKLLRQTCPLPFGLATQRPSNETRQDYPELAFNLLPGTITRERLGHFLKQTGWDQHKLHGTIGKAFDVLKAAGGIAITPETTAAHTDGDDFISYLDLRTLLKSQAETGNVTFN